MDDMKGEGCYILDDAGNPVPCEDLDEWAKCYGKADRRVALDKRGDISVSTVFLGLDHNWGEGPPLLYETMVFGGEHDRYEARYSTREEALKGHEAICTMVYGD